MPSSTKFSLKQLFVFWCPEDDAKSALNRCCHDDDFAPSELSYEHQKKNENAYDGIPSNFSACDVKEACHLEMVTVWVRIPPGALQRVMVFAQLFSLPKKFWIPLRT